MLQPATQRLVDDLDAILAADPHDLPDGALLAETEALLRERRRMDAAIARRLQVMDARDVTTSYCARSTRPWLIEDQHLSRGEAGALMSVARSSVTRPAIVEAMATGEASLDHARTITAFLPKLTDLDARDHAEKLLLDAAKDSDPTTMAAGLRQLADHLCLDETAEERAVRRHEGRWLTFADTIDGMVALSGMFDAPFGKIIKKTVTALAQRAGELDERTPQQRNADALVELAKMTMNRGELPDLAGEPTQVTVLTQLDDLARRMRPGESTTSTMDGTPITANTVRMQACDAGIIPVVMRGESEILDLGRATRTWTRAQRKAAKIRAHGHCEAPRCQATIDRCDLHHEHHWANGGRSDLTNGIYLCSYHHWLVHHTPWEITRSDNGQVEIRRT